MRTNGKLSQLGPAKEPFKIMSIDTIGGFGGNRSTKKYLHILVDHFTRYAYILCSKNQNAADFIRLIKKVSTENKIETILADQYGGINSTELKKFLEQEKIHLIFTAVNNPSSNGLNERLNQTSTIVNRIRCKINEKKTKIAWSKVAEQCIAEYNSVIHSATGFSPEYLMFGRKFLIIPEEIGIESNLMQDRKRAFENSQNAHEKNKIIIDKNRKENNFKVNDLVFVENGNKLNRKKT